MNGDNPTSASGVASCGFDEGSVSFIKTWSGSTNFVIDNFEFKGICWSGANQSPTYIDIGHSFQPQTTNRFILNNYIHGWTHVTFSCSAGPSGNCDASPAINVASGGGAGFGDILALNVIDGWDSDNRSYGGVAFGGYIMYGNVFTNIANGATTNNTHAFFGNIIDHTMGSSDGQAHGNGVEFNVEYNADNVHYNNIFRNQYTSGVGCGNQQFQAAPAAGHTDYEFGNVVYNYGCGGGNYWDICNTGCSTNQVNNFTMDIFNNTFVAPAGLDGPSYNSPSTIVINFENNHCIVNSGSTDTACFPTSRGGTINFGGNLVQSPAAADANMSPHFDQYASSQSDAYSPLASTNSTVGAGNTLISYCSALSGSSDAWLQRAGTACLSGTGYACTYDISNRAVSCPSQPPILRSSAWDVGAYQYSGQTQSLSPPTGLTAVVQ
jgi:hypothetical protein